MFFLSVVLQLQTCTFEHAELNCASCLNSITLGSTQVLHWKHSLLDWVIRPAVHFLMYTPQNGDICEKANKNIPGAKNAPGISSLYTWLWFLECTRLFSQGRDLSESGYWSCTREWRGVLLNGWHLKQESLKRQSLISAQTVRNLLVSCLGNEWVWV